MDNGYGQYVVLDLNETTMNLVDFEEEHYQEYNVQLDTYEHLLEYDSTIYIQDNTVTPYIVLNTSIFINPIVHIVTNVISWFK
jgi:hypothetical protein